MNKKILIITTLSMSLAFSACGKNNTKNESQLDNSTANNNVESTTKSKSTDEEIVTSSFDKELVDELVKNSDYISRVRLQTSKAEGVNSTFLKDYKGDLSKIDIALPKNLSPNQEYIIFYKDGENGEIIPTNDNSFIEIQDDKDSTLIYIEEKYPDTKNPRDMIFDSKEENTTNSKK